MLYAEQAGASFVVIYNNPAGYAGLFELWRRPHLDRPAGVMAVRLTIPSIFIGNTAGIGLVNWLTAHPTDAEVTLDNIAYQYGNTPDIIPSFSSRGPGCG